MLQPMKMTVPRRRARGLGALALALCLVLPLVLAQAAYAHQVWLEEHAGGTKLYFGEFGDNLHEVSPGYLDKLVRPTATLISGQKDKPLEAARSRDGVAFAGKPAKGEAVIALDAAYPLLENKDGGKTTRTAWTPAARYLPELAPAVAKLTLDVVPTSVPTNGAGEFQVTFRGAPLPKVEVTLTAVSGWSLSGTTNDQGKVSFKLPWKGTYALLVRHKDAKPGKRKGADGKDESFDAESFGTTLTFATTSGLPSPPAPPAAPPNVPEPKPAAPK